MHLKPLPELEDLETKRERLREILNLNLVSPELRRQIARTLETVEMRIGEIREEKMSTFRLAA